MSVVAHGGHRTVGPVAQAVRPATRVAHGLGLAILVATSALAQPTDPRTDAPVHVGPFYITPVLQLTRLGVDTNVFNTRGERQSDFTFTAGPKVDIAVPLRRFILTVETATDYVYYHRFDNQRGVNFDMNVRGEIPLRRVRFFLEDSFLNTRARPNVEIDVRARRTENAASAGLSIDLTRKIEVTLAASQAVREYDGDDLVGARLARSLNRDAVAARGSIGYAVTPLTAVRVIAEVREERFTLAPTRNNDSWSVVPGIEFHPRAIISGRADVGYRSLRGVDESLPAFSGPVASVDLAYRLLGSTTLAFTASRDVEFSFQALEPYYVATGYGISFRHQLTSSFGISVGTQQFDYRYRQFQFDSSDGPAPSRVDTTRRYFATLHRRLTRTMEIGLDVSHYARRSNSSQRLDYDGLLAGLTTAYAF